MDQRHKAYDRLIDSETRCYWVRDNEGAEFLIPACWACVIEGPSACTCEIEGSRLEQAERARHVAEHEVQRLRAKLVNQADLYAQSLRYQRRLWNENKRLRTMREAEQ